MKVIDKWEVRNASHAGTWYSKSSIELNKQLESWMDAAKKEYREVT